MQLYYSFIVPVYNRPAEIKELLNSLLNQTYEGDFEIIVVEDGSVQKAEHIVNKFKDHLNVSYLYKENSGPGLSRNYGMQKASGNYFLILDSDVIVPPDYLEVVDQRLQTDYTDFFGGPDAAHASFSPLQKAINYSMTAMLTTGGLRGKKDVKNFQPRSFNMGLSRKAFEVTGGFSEQHFGEDIDLTFRLWKQGFSSQFIGEAFVYHKRRTSLKSFFKQTFNFGAARPILNTMYPSTAKLSYWFPSLFSFGLIMAIVLFLFGWTIPLILVIAYFTLIVVDALRKEKSLSVGLLSMLSTLSQFFGYGLGYLRSFFRLTILGQAPEKAFPRMFR